MTRWLAVLSVLALFAGAMQARADVLPTEGDAAPCGEGRGPLCRIQTTEHCERWVSTEGSGGINPGPNIKLKWTCEKTSTSEKRYYYP